MKEGALYEIRVSAVKNGFSVQKSYVASGDDWTEGQEQYVFNSKSQLKRFFVQALAELADDNIPPTETK
jgi:hypothetical protein